MDFNATTPISPMVQERLAGWSEQWGNPSSIHQHGRGPKKLMRESRRSLAQALNCHPLELIFTAGGSEANNLALQGCLQELENRDIKKSKVLIGSIEHPSVLKQKDVLEKKGYQVELIPVNRQGVYDLEAYQKSLDENTAIVAVMLANNELGVIAPIKQMVERAHEKGAYFHTDGVQALGKMSFDLKDLNVDLASFSSHKVYALKGSGILYSKKGTPMTPMIVGGDQERTRRAGTENVLSIASLAFMVDQLDAESFKQKIEPLRDQMEKKLSEKISGFEVLCSGVERLPNTATFKIEGVGAESMLMNLDIRGFSVGTGAACSSGNPEPSPVLLAIGLEREEAQSSLRVSLGSVTTAEQVNSFVENLCEVVEHLRHLSENSGEVQNGI